MTSCWWFRLYTLPFLKKLGQFFLASLALDWLISILGHQSLFVFLLPLVALVNKFTPGSFRENIEFHKMNIPFGTLRRAFLLDVFITAGSYLLLVPLGLVFSHVLGGHFSTEASRPFWELTSAMILYYCLVAFISISWACFISVDKKYVFYGLKQRKFLHKVFFLGPVWTLCIVFMLVGLFMGFSVELSYTLLLGSLFFGASVFFLRAIFHQCQTHASLWAWLKHFGLGTAVLALVLCASAMMGRKDVLDKNLSVELRLKSDSFFGALSAPLNMEAFRELGPYMGEVERGQAYAKLDFDPSKLGLEYFLDDTQQKPQLLSFLQYGKPSADFLLSLYSHMGSNPEYWDRVSSAEWVRQLAFHRWPRDQELPEKYLAEKKKADDIAELKMQRRGVASGR